MKPDRIGPIVGDFQTSTGIRDIGYSPPRGAVAAVEVATIDDIRGFGGREEFRDTQRLMFEMVLFIESGRAVHEVDFAAHRLTPGSVLWVHAGQVQRWGEIEALDGVICMFPPTVVDRRSADLLGGLGAWSRSHWRTDDETCSAADDFRALLAAYRRVGVESDVHAAAAEASLVHRLSATLLALAASSTDGVEAAPSSDERLLRFRRDVDEYCVTERSVGFYARRLSMSERSLHRMVSGYLGVAPKKVIEARVVLEAKRLLVHGDEPVVAVAKAVGFDDPSNFAKFFKAAAGESPSRFRESNRRPTEP